MRKPADFIFDKSNFSLSCRGEWTILHLNEALRRLSALPSIEQDSLIINGHDITLLDSSGALALVSFIENKAPNAQVEFRHFPQSKLDLIQLVKEKHAKSTFKPKALEKPKFLYHVGVESFVKLQQIQGLLYLVGDLTEKIMAAFKQTKRFQVPSIVSNIDTTGLQALPILALLSFLIGVVLAYQMGLQLQTYGANIFIAFLSGMAIFREFAPLITAIIVAGRTSSAFTAQIGSMKINEEVDAIFTMGLSPTELLVMPKVLGLLLVFPLLIFWSDIFSLLGAMIMSKFMLNVSYYDFLHRLKESVGLKQMMLGLYKAPAFAILIALVGCFQGLRVESNASSIGSQTTKSVVQAIFLIIITDAIYSVIYSWMDL